MRKIFLFLIVVFAFSQTHAQYIHKIKADSVLITNDSCTAELNLENSTKHIKGFLYNKGNGRTEFRRAVKLNDSTFIFGDDTLSMRGGYNFTNGITQTGSNVKLGGHLTEPVVLTSNIDSPYTFQIKGSNSNSLSPYLFNATVEGGGFAISGFSGRGIGVYGHVSDPTNGIGVRADGGQYGLLAYAGTGTAVYGSTVQPGKPFTFVQNDILWGNGISLIGDFKRLATGTTVVDGFGLALDFKLASNVVATDRQAGRLAYKWTTAADATRTSAMELYTTNSAVMGRKAMLAGNGQWTWDGYPALPAQSDTAAIKPLGIDGSGNVVKMGSWSGSSGTAWSLTGNTGTLDSVNFIGTTDSVPLNFRVNNAKAGKIDLLLFNTFLGYTCGNVNTTGNANVAMGFESFLKNTTGSSNTAIGAYSLKNSTSGTVNTALGATALWLNTTGSANTAIGTSALKGNLTGGSNTALGVYALGTGTAGSYNTILGGYAAYPLNGSNNIVIGYSAANNMLSGNANIIIGTNCNPPVATGSNQLVLGNLIYGTGLDGTNSTISNGKIGIKTQAPAYELDVNGKLGVRTMDSTSTAANMLYQDAATGEIKKAAYSAKQSFAQTATATVANVDDETTLISSGTGSLTIPAAAWFAGKSFRISVRGVYSTSTTNPAGIRIKIKLGSTVIAQSANIFIGTAKVDIPFEIRGDLTCRAIGSSGSLYTMGMFYSDDGTASKIDNGLTATTVNLSTSQTLDITATLSDSSSGNSISAFIVTFEAIN